MRILEEFWRGNIEAIEYDMFHRHKQENTIEILRAGFQ